MGLERFLRTGIAHSRKAVHGGNVWEFVEGGFLGKSADVIDFSSNINPLGPSKKALEATREGLWKLSHYPEAQAEPLKKELSKYLEVKKENLTCGNGSAELIRNFCDAFLGRSDRALVCGPTFSEYEVYTKLYGAEVKYLLAEPPKFSISVEDIVERIDGKIKATFICNPNNPTGMAMRKQELKAIKAGHTAMKRAVNIIQGDPDKKMMFDMATESVVEDIHSKIGEMERFIELSGSFIDSIDLQNGVYEQEGLELLEKLEKDGASFLLGDPKTEDLEKLDVEDEDIENISDYSTLFD